MRKSEIRTTIISRLGASKEITTPSFDIQIALSPSILGSVSSSIINLKKRK